MHAIVASTRRKRRWLSMSAEYGILAAAPAPSRHTPESASASCLFRQTAEVRCPHVSRSRYEALVSGTAPMVTTSAPSAAGGANASVGSERRLVEVADMFELATTLGVPRKADLELLSEKDSRANGLGRQLHRTTTVQARR
ncbi:hypothetical protein GGTG_01634 [Gaeumannomyces tritici R3-111a-1]|uniref:Uncharacterized protein n=1 Tax=Gaeumannomyces tritici (strain R3-111a-1) TaxID=644352 RepID=J3NK52_GAET3|nr:hypothetical protein GGTG_01634 [Gaeumannomyces tritici R3-111a-1]EJT81656.1 hypothetical protein GGTG_01634 [Gaeumannomyces tritici R3-111a-1]